jgi:predicted nucleic acid-binding protein
LRFIAPDLLSAEFGNVLWKKVLFQGLPVVDAKQILDDFRKLTVDLTPTGDLLDDAFHLAVTHRRSVYDMLYLALSIREKCRFVTADEKLVNAVSAAIPDVVWVARWP